MKARTSKTISSLLLCVYFLLLLRLIVFKGSLPFLEHQFSGDHVHILETGLRQANFIPFKTLYYYFSLQEDVETGLKNIGGNIALLIPYGFLLPLAFPPLRSLPRLMLAVLITSFCFELIQLVLAIGNFDVDDLLLNTLGGLAGRAMLLARRNFF